MSGDGGDGDGGDDAGEDEKSEYDEDGNKIEKKVVKKEEPKRDFSNRISSEKDQMIELEPQKLAQTQSSAAVLCFSNYKEKFITVQSFDLKTRRRVPLLKIACESAPTKLFQLD